MLGGVTELLGLKLGRVEQARVHWLQRMVCYLTLFSRIKAASLWPGLTFLLASVLVFGAQRADASTVEWMPITPEELAFTSVPGAPNAPAVCLLYEVFTDDAKGRAHLYRRIKVLTEEGRSEGNIVIAYATNLWNIKNLQVRTIQPNGAVSENPVAPMDSVVYRYRRFKSFAKVLAIPEVHPGTIIEYQYDIEWDRGTYPWVVPGDLFTVRANFTRRRYPNLNFHMYSSRLPEGQKASESPDGLIHLTLTNVPATLEEDFMPPEGETRPRVDCYYYFGKPLPADMTEAWAEIAKDALESIQKYLSHDHGLDILLAETVKPEDSPEVKLRKLYDRVQSMRNLSFEDEATATKNGREKIKPPENVGDVIKRGYGWHRDLDILFMALAQRAGFQAWLLDVARRDGELFFDSRSLSIADLPDRAVLVRVNDKNYFLDPGTVLLPFGWLAWGETPVKALRLDMQGGELITTPEHAAADSMVSRKAELKLTEEGSLEGKVRVTYTGYEAIDRRFDARKLDEVARQRTLEEELKAWIPANAEVELVNKPEWSRPDPTLTAEFNVKIREWGTALGQRLLFREGIFANADRAWFQSDTRVHDIYFPYCGETRDFISISIPEQFHVEAFPPAKSRDLGFLTYTTAIYRAQQNIEISRQVVVGRTFVGVGAYDGIHALCQDLRSADDSQIVLTSAGGSASGH